MKKAGSWQTFFLGIGFLIIMMSPQAEAPAQALLGGCLVVILSVIAIVRKKNENHPDEE